MANVGEALERILTAAGDASDRLVLDLDEMQYLDSAGVRMIFELAERLERQTRPLALVLKPDAQVRRVVTITKLDTLVPVHEDVESALGA